MGRRKKTSPEDSFSPLQKQILASLRIEIKPPSTTTAYKLGMFAVALVNLLLPLMYFGLIFLVLHGLYWNARYNEPTRGWGGIIYFAAYLLGSVTLVFLIKPLFSRDPEVSPPLTLKPTAEPFLYAYVDAICDAVNAPYPDSIQLVCEPNAAAGFADGLMGIFTGRMRLTIGLPLVTGMSVRQLTGVLAHEFGHFSQGTGMRMSFIVRIINFWLIKIVFLRDAWDARLEGLAQNGDWRWWVVVQSVRSCIWLSRQLLFGLLWAGNVVSCYLMRQMEFDADRYEARLVGHRTFGASCRRLLDLNIAHHMAIGDLQQFHSEGRLVDDFPTLIASNVPLIKPEVRKKYRRKQLEQQTGLFDTHPADRDRIENARQEDANGAFQLSSEQKDPAAAVLFSQLERICRAMTSDFYESVLGKQFKKKLLHPVKQLMERRDAEQAAGKALDRYFQVHVPIDRPLPLYADSDKAPPSAKQVAYGLKESRDTMLRELEAYKHLPALYDAAENTMLTTVEALSLLDCGLRIRGSDFGLPDSSLKTAELKHKRALHSVQFLAAKMLTFETAASERLSAALQLLQVPKVAETIPNGVELQEEVRNMIRDARLISNMIGELPSLRIMYRRIAILFSRLGNQQNRALVESIIGQLEGITMRLTTIYHELHDVRYPFDHANDNMTLQEFVIPYLPEAINVGGVVNATQLLFERLYVLQVRLFARLAQAAEQVETVLGLPPLPDYVPEPEKQGRG